jgi:uncharacterized protein (TIGR00725 family)
MLTLDRGSGALWSGGRRFDPASRSWGDLSGEVTGELVSPMAAVVWLQRETQFRLKPPIGVIGPREASAGQCALAEAIGGGLADMGLTVICGGRQGIMEAVSKGVSARGGLTIGLLPGPDAAEANPFVGVPIATGIGEARNALIARAAFCLVAVGNSYGTLSEVALGLQFGKTLFGIGGAASVPDIQQFAEPEALLEALARLVLALPADQA